MRRNMTEPITIAKKPLLPASENYDLLRLAGDGGFDVVHANNTDWPTGISAVRQLGVKLVVSAHKVRPPAWPSLG